MGGGEASVSLQNQTGGGSRELTSERHAFTAASRRWVRGERERERERARGMGSVQSQASEGRRKGGSEGGSQDCQTLDSQG